MSRQAFRFGYQLSATSAEELLSNAIAAENAGFDVLHTFDHVGADWSPLAPLMAVAMVTQRVRLCPLVMNNDLRHPVELAREVAAIDRFSNGRVEVGLGAGHSFTEYEAIGLSYDVPAIRKARLAEATEILRRLLDGEAVSFHGDHYQLRDVRTMTPLQEHLPILVGVNGRRALAHAARHADTISLTGLGRTRADGQRHETRWELDRLDRTIEFVHEAAKDRTEPLELHALVQAVIVTEDREATASKLVNDGVTSTTEDALHTPFLAIGTHAEIADHLRTCRSRWGITYFSVRDIESFAPVIRSMDDTRAAP